MNKKDTKGKNKNGGTKMKNWIIKKERNNGITLIALVITIIVLLILAGVTIASITGENGILSKATNARDNNAKASAEERVKTEVLGSYGSDGNLSLDDLNKNLTNIEGLKYNGSAISDSNKIESLPATVNVDGYNILISEEDIETIKTIEEAKSNDMLTKNEDTPITVDNKIVKIPAGFKVADDSGNTIDEGIVIEDSEKNQFVWVPVSKENFATEFVRREGYYDGGNLENVISDCGEANAKGENKKFTETETTQKEAIKMYASVKRNEGFYIARYEAGNDGNGNVVLKKGADVYNEISWSANGDNMQETTGITGGAVELSRNFANAKNYKTVTSTLIYGVQWDTVMKWMENVNNPNGKKYIQDSTGMGWYSDNSGDNPQKTGIDIGEENRGSNQVKKIYDLAGNVFEWTMESYSTDGRVVRGGNYGGTGSNNPASNRNSRYPSFSDSDIGFRPTLFLNS